MAFAPIAYIAPNYRDFKNEWLKAYEPGTTTPKVMATDSSGSPTVAKLQLNADGFLVSAGAALVMPHIEGAYDLWLFPTEAEADANDTSNAERLADDLTAPNSINDLSQAYEFTELSDAVNFDDLVIGKVCNIKERVTGWGGGAVWDAVDIGSVTVNTFNVVAHSLGVLALVLREKPSYSFTEFGADPTDATSSYGAIKACFETANAEGANVKQTYGTFLLDKAGDGETNKIIITVDADLQGAVLDINQFEGWFEIQGTNAPIEYLTGSPVITAMNLTAIESGQSNWPGLDAEKSLDNCFVIIEAEAQEMYKFRGVQKYRKDYNKFYNKGIASSTAYYPYNQDITKVTATLMAENWTTINGFTFRETDIDEGSILVVSDATKVNITNTSFYNNRVSEQLINAVRLTISNSCLIRVNGLYTDSVNRTSDDRFTYTIAIDNCYDVSCEDAISDGYGWGATGSNNSARIEFKDCQLSRIDFHEPCQDFLKITNCELGSWGVLATMQGDLVMDKVTIIIRDDLNNDGFIRTRADAGGWSDGSLIITDMKIEGKKGAPLPALFACAVEADSGVSVGSPIANTFFKTVKVNGISIGSTDEFTTVFSYFFFAGAGNGLVDFPYDVSISEWKRPVSRQGVAEDVVMDFSQMTRFSVPRVSANLHPLIADYTNIINIESSQVSKVTILEPSILFSPKINFSNCTGIYDQEATIYSFAQRGFYTITNSDVRQLVLTDVIVPDGEEMYINISGGRFAPVGNEFPMLWDVKSVVSLDSADILYENSSQAFRYAQQMEMTDCKIYKVLAGVPSREGSMVIAEQGGSFDWDFVCSLKYGASYVIRLGSLAVINFTTFKYSAAGVYNLTTMTGSLNVTVVDNGDGSHNVNILPTNPTDILTTFSLIQ